MYWEKINDSSFMLIDTKLFPINSETMNFCLKHIKNSRNSKIKILQTVIENPIHVLILFPFLMGHSQGQVTEKIPSLEFNQAIKRLSRATKGFDPPSRLVYLEYGTDRLHKYSLW